MLFYLSLLIFIVFLPPFLISVALLFLSKRHNISYRMVGYLKFKDILIVFENEKFKVSLRLDLFQIYLIWLRCRILFKGFDVKFMLKKNYLFEKVSKQPRSKSKYFENYGN